MWTLAMTLAVAAADSTAAAVPPAAPASAPDPAAMPRAIDDAASARALCDALTPAGWLPAKGNAVEQGRAEAEQEARREEALRGRYMVVVPGDRLRFAPYDAEERRLALSDRTFLAGADGALRLWAVEDAQLPVAADAAAAERVMDAAKRSTLRLVLTFALPEDDAAAVCAHPAGSDRYGLGVEPVEWSYLDGDAPLARGGEGADRPSVTAADGARPRVEVADPLGGARAEVKRAVAARAGDLEGCYRRALQASPGLDGSVVADVELGTAGGAPRAVRVGMDSVQDDAVTSCVVGVLSKVDFPRQAGARATVPIHFVLDPPDAQGAGSGGR